MNNPQERIIKKMIDDIVESNKPYIEKPASVVHAESAQTTSAPNASAPTSAAMAPEDYTLIGRKLEYGFNSLRQDNAELRKQVDELVGAIKMLRNDMDQVRMAVQQKPRAHDEPIGHMSPPAREAAPRGMANGAPQYRKTEADEAYERETGEPSHHDEPQQARGIQKKDHAEIDINKVFYYGKK